MDDDWQQRTGGGRGERLLFAGGRASSNSNFWPGGRCDLAHGRQRHLQRQQRTGGGRGERLLFAGGRASSNSNCWPGGRCNPVARSQTLPEAQGRPPAATLSAILIFQK